MKKIPSGLGKAAAVAVLATMASASLLSITAAGGTEAIAPTPTPTETVEATAPATPEPSPTVTPTPEPTLEPAPPTETPREGEYQEAVPWVPGAPFTSPVAPREDEPGFDCRIHGNQMCGVLIEDTWYVVTFRDGLPASVTIR